PDIWRFMRKLSFSDVSTAKITCDKNDIIEYFSKVGSEYTPVDTDNFQFLDKEKISDDELNFLGAEILEAEVIEAIRHIRKGGKKKGCGSNGIHPLMISETLEPILCEIFNQSLTLGILPKLWYEGMIIPIPKKSNCRNPSDTRP